MSETADRAATGGRPQNLAARSRVALMSLLDSYHQVGGRGPDAYHEAPLVHPMAEGRFLAALATAAQTRLIPAGQVRSMAEASLLRLEQTALPFASGLGWGLGFAHGASDRSEPFLITTAMIAEGLIELAPILPDQPLAARLRGGSLDAIRTWCRTECVLNADLDMELPIYSATVRRPILNAAIYAISVLARSAVVSDGVASADLVSSLRRIRDRRRPGLGWLDDPDSPVIDLLHQCFILNSLSAGLPADQRNMADEDLAMVETMSLFSAMPGFLDTASLLCDPELPPSAGVTLRPIGNAFLAVRPKPARLWSLGELLVALSWRISGRSDGRAGQWRAYAAPACEALLARLAEGDAETGFPRQQMYAAFGLARFLAALRSDRAGISHA